MIELFLWAIVFSLDEHFYKQSNENVIQDCAVKIIRLNWILINTYVLNDFYLQRILAQNKSLQQNDFE